jgi:hypothetical protein
MSRDVVVKWFNAIVILVCLVFLGVSAFKAVIVSVVALTCHYLNYGSRWVARAGFGLLIVSLLVFMAILPEPHEWSKFGQSALDALRR